MRFRLIQTIASKEFQSYFDSPLGYIFIISFWVSAMWFFFNNFFLLGQTTMRAFFELLPWIYLFLIPAVTMRLWAEERKMGTLELLLTAPLHPSEAVLGKFLASIGLLFCTLIFSCILPLLLWVIGQPDFGAIAGGYIGALLLSSSYLAIGLFISSITDNQITAFLISVFVLVFLLVIGNDVFLKTLPEALVPTLKYLSIDLHFKSLLRGVVDSRDIVYYVSIIFFCLHLNILHLRHRQWK